MTRNRVTAVVAAVVLLASCASAAPKASKKAPKPPAWVDQKPQPDATYTYFVGMSSDPNGDVATATNDAANNIIASVMMALGVDVSVNVEGQADATLDSYQASIRQTVTSKAENRLVGFEVKEKFVETNPKTGRVTVHVLASYVTAELNKEKQRIENERIEREKAVSVPENAGLAFMQENRHYEAVRKFVEAAVAATGPKINNPDVKVERNINNARTALSKLRLVGAPGAQVKAFVGQPFPSPFQVRLVAGEGDSAPGVPGASLLVSYQRKQGNRTGSKTDPAVSGPGGLLSFSPPVPDFVGKAKLTVKLDFQSTIDLLDKIPAKYEAQREALMEDFKGKYIEIPYEVSSNAKNIPTGVALVDLDEAGKTVAGAQTQGGLVDALAKARFVVKALVVDPALLVSMDEAAVLAAAKAAGLQRIAFGTARIETVRKDGANFLTTAKAQVKVLEVATGLILYSAEKGASGFGQDEQAARRAVYRDLGASAIGQDLLANLP